MKDAATRVGVGLALIIVLLAAAGGLAMKASLDNEEALVHTYGEHMRSAVHLADANDALWRLRYQFPQFLVLGKEDRERMMAEEPLLYRRIEQNLAAYRPHAGSDESTALDQLKASYQRYVAARPKWFELIAAGRMREAAEYRARTTTPFGAETVERLDKLIALQQTLANKEVAELSGRAGVLRWWIFAGLLVAAAGATALLWLSRRMLAEMSRRIEAEGRLEVASRAFENTADSVIIYDAEWRIVSVNRAFTTITGYQAHELVGKTPESIRSREHGAEFYSEMRRQVAEMGIWRGEMTRRRKDGALFPTFSSMSAVRDEAGKILNFVTVFNDVSSFKQYEQKLEFMAHYDALTELPNRTLFLDKLKEALVRAQRHRKSVGVLFIDLDEFKTINDSLGHHVGDGLLRAVAATLVKSVRESDVVARLGGDEFIIMVDELDNTEHAGKVAENVLRALASPIDIGEHKLVTSGSIGIGCYPHDGQEPGTLLKNADAAMYAAKEAGRAGYRFFTREMNERAMQRVQMEAAMRLALQRNEFVLHYQPKVQLASGEIYGIEALLRWAHPERGLVSPAEFIPVLEDCGLIVPVGEWVTREACRQIKAWQQTGLTVPPVAVNLSARQFQHKDLDKTIGAILRDTGVAPELLQFEITESMLMGDPASAERTLRALKQAGVRLSIDDFGTGYSSLAYLRRFPLDMLKIDRAFVKDMVGNPDDAAITLAVISLAHSLGLKVVAEGVETEAQVNLLALHSCDEMQGYYFSKPVPPTALETMLREKRRLVRSQAWTTAKPAVLLLDDNEDDLRLLQGTLRSDKFEILAASNVAQAFSLLASHRISVIISDQRMPGMDGAEFLAKLKQLHPHALRIAISGTDDADTVVSAVNQAGVYKFLSKNWNSDRLRNEVLDAYRLSLKGSSPES